MKPPRQYAEILRNMLRSPRYYCPVKLQKSNKKLKKKKKIQNWKDHLILLPVCTEGAACRLRWQQPHVGGGVARVVRARRLHQVLPHQRLHFHGAGQEDLGDRAHQCKSFPLPTSTVCALLKRYSFKRIRYSILATISMKRPKYFLCVYIYIYLIPTHRPPL